MHSWKDKKTPEYEVCIPGKTKKRQFGQSLKHSNTRTEIEHTEEGVISSDLNKRPQVEEEMDRICAKRVTDG